MMTVLLRIACAMAIASGLTPVSGEGGTWPAGRDRAVAQQRDQERESVQQVERFTRSIRVGPTGELELSNISGDIIIAGGDGDEIRIEVTKRARDRSPDEVRRQLSLVQVEIIERGSRVEVRTRYPREEGNVRVSVEFEVMVPARTRVFARSISGDLEVSDIQGAVQAQSVSGDLDLRSIPRLISAKSVSGDLSLNNVGGEGDLAVSTVSGDLDAKGLRASRLELGTVSGDLRLTEIACDRATVKSVSGTVQYAGQIGKSGRYDLSSHSGDVRLELAGEIGFELEASSFSGSVRSDFPLTLSGTGSAPGRDAPDSRGHRSRSIRGVYGDGSALIEVTTFSGDIVIMRR